MSSRRGDGDRGMGARHLERKQGVHEGHTIIAMTLPPLKPLLLKVAGDLHGGQGPRGCQGHGWS